MNDTTLKISKLPDGRYHLSTQPRFALSETELRDELEKQHQKQIVDKLIRVSRSL
jgi:hypothetical protein